MVLLFERKWVRGGGRWSVWLVSGLGWRKERGRWFWDHLVAGWAAVPVELEVSLKNGSFTGKTRRTKGVLGCRNFVGFRGGSDRKMNSEILFFLNKNLKNFQP
ncbi:hypothetical protein R3W88_016909 [Solanum pinnatisectum]|uniref:Uncharacterized protein n=1 Tax=Solanum pinnatisectum TaxID=50273 RepID=A0AAV9KYN1_9SOLN|nr:hypothetical protein R3W88_016909 [Solanum pinnatisectum]